MAKGKPGQWERTVAKPKPKRKKAYKPKPVHRLPTIMLNLEAPQARIDKLTSVARQALLKLYYEAAEEADYYILTRVLFVGHRLSKNFEEQDSLRELETTGVITIVELEQRQLRGEVLQREKIARIEDALELAVEEMSKSKLFDVIEADSYFEIYHEDILKNLRELVTSKMDELAEAEAKLKASKKEFSDREEA